MKGNCKNIDVCPSASAWCLNREPSTECVDFLCNKVRHSMQTATKALELGREIVNEIKESINELHE